MMLVAVTLPAAAMAAVACWVARADRVAAAAGVAVAAWVALAVAALALVMDAVPGMTPDAPAGPARPRSLSLPG